MTISRNAPAVPALPAVTISDLHAHGDAKSVTYKKARGQTAGNGNFKTPFAGEHGWFWRNRDKKDVTVTLQVRGEYSEPKQKKK